LALNAHGAEVMLLCVDCWHMGYTRVGERWHAKSTWV